jgi:uncharacterized protein (TIGR03086 family)
VQVHTNANTNPLDLLKQANEVFLGVLGNVSPEQMNVPTVNDDWDVRALINHLVAGNLWIAELVKTGDAQRPSGDAIGDRDPREAYAASWQTLVTALEEPGVLGRTVQMPFGEVPAAAAVALRFSDTIGHAWDLAKATGQETDIAPELCEAALALARQRLEGQPRVAGRFKEEVLVPADACAADRLAAYLGKPV